MLTWRDFLKAVLRVQLTEPEATEDSFVFVTSDGGHARRHISHITAENGEVLIHIEE